MASSKATQVKDGRKALSDSQYEEIFDAVVHFQGNKSPVQAESMKIRATEPGESASTGQESSSQFSSSLSQLASGSLVFAPDAGLSQAPKNIRHSQRLQWLQDRRGGGLYIQCDICKKWRWSDIDDPVDVPKKWSCRQNPDTNYNACIIPEKPISIYIEEDLIDNEYTAGSVVWAKLFGFPWWPAMVDDCPDTEQYYWLDGNSDIPMYYHVVFFDYESNEISRSWVAVRELISFKHQPSLDNKFSLKPGHKSRISCAKEQALEALKLRVKERLQRYSFLARWTGEIVTPPASDTEQQETAAAKRRGAGKRRRRSSQKKAAGDKLVDTSDEELEQRSRRKLNKRQVGKAAEEVSGDWLRADANRAADEDVVSVASELEHIYSQDSSMESFALQEPVTEDHKFKQHMTQTLDEHMEIFDNSTQSVCEEDDVDLKRLREHIIRSQLTDAAAAETLTARDVNVPEQALVKNGSKRTGRMDRDGSMKKRARKTVAAAGEELEVRQSKETRTAGKENQERWVVEKKRIGKKLNKADFTLKRRPSSSGQGKRQKIARTDREQGKGGASANSDSTPGTSDSKPARSDSKLAKDDKSDTKLAKSDTKDARSASKPGKDTMLAKSDTTITKSDIKLAKSDTEDAKRDGKPGKDATSDSKPVKGTKDSKSDSKLVKCDTKDAESDIKLAKDTKDTKSVSKLARSDTKVAKSDSKIAKNDTNAVSVTKVAKSDTNAKDDTEVDKRNTKIAKSDSKLAKSDTRDAISDSKLAKDTKFAKTGTKIAKSDTQLAKSDTKDAKSDSKLATSDTKDAKSDSKLAKDTKFARTGTKIAKSDTQLAKSDSKLARNDTKVSMDDTTAKSDTKLAKSDTKLAKSDTKSAKTITKPIKPDTKPSSTDTNKPSTSGLNNTTKKRSKKTKFQPPVRKSSTSESAKSEEHSEPTPLPEQHPPELDITSSQSLISSSVAVVPNSEDQLIDILNRLSQESLPFDP
ncbi:hypothetical protein CBL_09783 [Carabus blaptoides fortunei]